MKRAFARERVLADLGRRRGLLQAQVEELRQGRDRLLEAYRVVKRTFLDATEALAQVEARAASERAHAVDSGEHAALRDDTQGLALESEAVAIAGETLVAGEPAADATSDAETRTPKRDDRETGSAEMADVDSLFARIRAGHTEVAAATEADTMLPSRPDGRGSPSPRGPRVG